MIIFYSRTCEGCLGNQALTKMEAECKRRGIPFQERRTILWKFYEDEANRISKELGVKIPFFLNTETGKALEGTTFTPIEDIIKLTENH